MKTHLAVLGLLLALSACNNNGGAARGEGPVDNPPPPPVNTAPRASVAPATLVVDEGAAVALDGAGSLDAEDGTALTFAWSKVSGPDPQSPGPATQPSFAFTAPQVTGQQLIVVELRVTDSQGLSDTARAAVTVRDTTVPPPPDQAPVARAGADQAASSGQTVTLDGAASSDAEGPLTFSWTQADGPEVTIRNADRAIASFTAPAVTALANVRLLLAVRDSAGQSAVDEIVVAVVPPAANGSFMQTQCEDGGGPQSLCDLLGTLERSQPDRLPLAAYATPRGALSHSVEPARTPSAKTVDGQTGDWIGVPTFLSGTARLDAGEWIYSDYLFDAYGADDGGDQERLQLLDPLAQIEPRTFRFDQLFQAAGDQFGAPQPIGAPDRYGDALALDAEADLFELRWAADAQRAYLLARFTTLTDAAKPALLVLIDNASGDTAREAGFGSGLSTTTFERAILVTTAGVQARDLVADADIAVAGAQVAIEPSGFANALEAALPASLLAGATRIAVVSGARTAEGLTPANVAYRFAEPVAGIYNDKLQALSLLAGNVDAFAAPFSLAALRGGVTEGFTIGAGYYERQFVSGANISSESGESGIVQPYGLYVPTAYRSAAPYRSPLTFWLHYRGGKAHSGAAWTPRLITQLGEEQANLVVTPRGRGTSTWYVTQAHQDFFEVFADVHALFPNVDPQRRYLSGYSMGGYGTYLLGLLYPDLFAAGYSTSGATTQGAWTGLGPDDAFCDLPGGEIPEVGEASNPCFIEANDGDADAQLTYRLLDNARHFPIVIHHGSNDELVPITGVQRFGARLAALNYRYDLSMFFGYEHYTQAIIDEWADGAFYLNRFVAPRDPRRVTYVKSPALARALNTVQARGVAFAFDPDGAYWLDGLAVRDPDPADPSQLARVDAQSFAIAEPTRVPVPRAGDVAPAASPPQLGTPVASPGSHTTPFARHGLDWIDGPALAQANAFTARLERTAAVQLDLARMRLDLSTPVTGTVDSDGPGMLTMSGANAPVQVFVNGRSRSGAQAGGRIVLALAAGPSLVQLLPPGAPAPTPDFASMPSLALACLANVPADALCSAIASASDALAGGCSAFGSPAFCSAFGGNLHALIDGCRDAAGAQGELVCKLAEQFVFGLASACQAAGAPQDVCALARGELIADSAMQRFESSWAGQALALQRALGAPLALRDAEYLSTHNSFNATTNNLPPTLSGSDANQKYSIPDQLRLGVRGLELDVHWWFSAEGSAQSQGRAPVLCHGNVAHFGCTTERSLRAGLIEIRDWLGEHPGEVIVIDLEDHLGEPIDDALLAHQTAAGVLESVLGPMLLKPADLGRSCADGFPVEISTDAIRAAGKQVAIYTGCGAGSAWPELVWQRQRHTQSSISGLGDAAIAFPDQCVFTPQQYAENWTRFFEDHTLLGTATGAARKITAPEVVEMLRCGVNMPSLDMVGPNDPRLPAFVWSWAPGEPDENASKRCARHRADGRFEAAACSAILPFACLALDGTWRIGLPAGSATTSACPAGSQFAVPRSSEQNERLKAAKLAAGVGEVWLRYAADDDGAWRAP